MWAQNLMNQSALFFFFSYNFNVHNWQFHNNGEKKLQLYQVISLHSINSTLPWGRLYISHLKVLFTKSANHFTIELRTTTKKLSIKVVETPANYHLGMK